ncbi:hypothetical protein GBZ26_06080 [Azospirillum formosense]|uniref:adenosine deaminase n=1 Tax=Azospirillum formosense TaxID=861533 RepID=A0ABX2KY49_9PROT|nr:hypothetical protein [Azospirillum formosense]MBY3754363.1 hypothetical protein [Azospirillum formosense]NUB18781.1 hypothetical protein [Azospirillum formosense]
MELFYREVLRHVDALRIYLSGRLPDFDDDVQRGLFLRGRANDPSRPDHFLKAAKERTVGQYTSLSDLLVGTVGWMRTTFLQEDGHRHYCVPTERFEAWQELLTDVPPLLVVADALRQRRPFGNRLLRLDAEAFLSAVVRPQLRYSSLPTVREPRLDHLIRSLGLDEMHMHLNGGTETELVWLDAMAKPKGFALQFLKSELNSEVIEQLQQDDQMLTHRELLRRLHVARRLRRLLTYAVILPLAGHKPVGFDGFSNRRLTELMACDVPAREFEADWPFPASEHPIESAYGKMKEDVTPLMQEALFLAAILSALETTASDWLVHVSYCYLLLQSQFMRMLVQQRDQYGFDQFQKITINELRELTEKTYESRFHQLDFTERGDLDLLEGRFAPKANRNDTAALLAGIIQGYQRFHGRKFNKPPTLEQLLDDWQPPVDAKRLRLALVGHFVKLKDTWKPGTSELSCRHYTLRQKLRTQWNVLSKLVQRYPNLRRYLVGFDAAANELHAPPEVFAPLFRTIRKSGFNHFSYHAGEDFVHLLSGIRAVYETVKLVGLQCGNRIGHATAVGIEPALWRERMGSVITLTRGQRLDDLVLAHRLLSEVGESGAIVRLGTEIGRLSREIYGSAEPPDLLYEAWEMRRLDPLVAFGLSGSRLTALDQTIEAEFAEVEEARKNWKAFDLFTRYHGAGGHSDVVRCSEEKIAVDCEAMDEPLNSEQMRLLQDCVLKKINTRGIVLETLPTSNIRISVYRTYAEHHVFRWMGLKGRGERMNVCVGSDDPGIFATNLRNEYAHLLRELDRQCASIGRDSLEELRSLIESGKIWRFQSNMST